MHSYPASWRTSSTLISFRALCYNYTKEIII